MSFSTAIAWLKGTWGDTCYWWGLYEDGSHDSIGTEFYICWDHHEFLYNHDSGQAEDSLITDDVDRIYAFS